MKILEINAVSGYGSTGVIVRDIKRLCEEKGFSCEIVYSLKNEYQNSGNGYPIGFWLTNKIHAALSRIGGKQGYFSFLSTNKLIRFLENTLPDIIHLHNIHNSYINIPLLFSYIKEKKNKGNMDIA